MDPKDLLAKIYSLKRVREYWEPYSYMARKAYEGKHFTAWNKTSQQLTEVSLYSKGQIDTIPELANETDKLENFFLSTDFTFTMIPTKLSDDDALKEAMSLSMLASTYHKKLKDSTVYADYIHNAALDNVSFIEVTPNDLMTDVIYRGYDLFDILFDPRIGDWNQQRLIVKVVKRKINDVKQSALYHFETDPTSGDTVFNSWKEVLESEKYGSFVDLEEDECLLFECYILAKKENPETHKDELILNIVTIDGAGNIGRNDEYSNIHVIPIVPFRIFSGSWYQPSFVFRQIPLARTIDMTNHRVQSILLRMAKGGLILQEEEEVDGAMNEETGQMIRYKSFKPEQMQMPNIPAFLPEWFNTTIGLAERYGVSSLMAGNLPQKASGIRASQMISQLTALAQKNNSAPINSLKSATKQILEITFQFLYQMWETPHDVVYADFSQEAPQFVSKKVKDYLYADNKQVVGIPSSFSRFEVDVDNGLGYTLEERKKTALELYAVKDEAGKPILSSEAVKGIFKLGSSGYLMEADEAEMFQSPEFQTLINNFPKMNPDQQQSLIKVLGMVSAMTGNRSDHPGAEQDIMSKLMSEMNQGGKGGGAPSGGNAPPSGGSPTPNQPPPQGGGNGQ